MSETTIGVSHTTKENLRKFKKEDEDFDNLLFEICQFLDYSHKEWTDWRVRNHGSFPEIS